MKKIISILILLTFIFSRLLFAEEDGQSVNNNAPDSTAQYEEYTAEAFGGLAGAAVGMSIAFLIAREYCEKNPDAQCGTSVYYGIPAVPVLASAGVYSAGSFFHPSGSYTDALLGSSLGCCAAPMVEASILSILISVLPQKYYEDESFFKVFAYSFFGLMAVGATAGAMRGYHDSLDKNEATDTASGALLNISDENVKISFPVITYSWGRSGYADEHFIAFQIVKMRW